MGKKREKGKARKAKAAAAQLAATQEAPLNAGASVRQAMVESEAQAWRNWAIVGRTRGCTHGCPLLPAPDHAVSLFMDALWANSNDKKSPDRYLLDLFDNHRQVWDNAILRKLALDISVAIGTNFIMSNLDKFAVLQAITMSAMEHYSGHGKDDFSFATCKSYLLVDDLRCGEEREVVRFYLKRISCTCLKAKYSLIKKSQPARISACSTCNHVKVRSSMMLCGLCRARQYCCEECQAADWPNHKGQCRSIHEQMKK
jgi:hypothetical protein